MIVWATLKTECFAREKPPTRHAARLQVFDYLEVFYNRRRLHSGLGYQSPLAFERTFSYHKTNPHKTTKASSTFSKQDQFPLKSQEI